MVLAESVNSISNHDPSATPQTVLSSPLEEPWKRMHTGRIIEEESGSRIWEDLGGIWVQTSGRHLGGILEAQVAKGAQGHIVARSGVTTLRNAKSSLICLRVTSVITAYLQQLMLAGSVHGTLHRSRTRINTVRTPTVKNYSRGKRITT